MRWRLINLAARISRWLTWVCVVVLAALSLAPGEELVRTGLPGKLEHFIAYFVTGAIAAVGYGSRAGAMPIAVLLSSYAGLLELGQVWAPGRHSRFSDFAMSAAGAIAGVAFARYFSPASMRRS